MSSYEHQRIVENIRALTHKPGEPAEVEAWLRASPQIDFLERNASERELVVFAQGSSVFIHSALISNDYLATADVERLLRWQGSPYDSSASYAYDFASNDIWIECQSDNIDSSAGQVFSDLVFIRTPRDWPGGNINYVEIVQEYAHLYDIHFRPEHNSYCRFDPEGDIEHVVSVTTKGDDGNGVTCVSFSWKSLEEYMVVCNCSLIRRFDFTMFEPGSFNGWSREPEELIDKSPTLRYCQKVDSLASAYTTGIQIIKPRRTRDQIAAAIKGETNIAEYVEFLAYDWRNGRIDLISTDPSASANYFNAEGSKLPFELSPAFFRPDVMLKYGGDPDKYAVAERHIRCRSAWSLEAFDVNAAGQVFAYIRYLRSLPYTEQLYWKSFNEEPRAPISGRAIAHDFEGKWEDHRSPLEKVRAVVMDWHESNVNWWKLRDPQLLETIHTPLTVSRKEWSDAFGEISKLVVEGFVVTAIRAALNAEGLSYDKEERSLVLLERLLNHSRAADEPITLSALRAIQVVRSKVKSHADASAAEKLAKGAIAGHGSLKNHFNDTCLRAELELHMISDVLSRH